MRNNPEQLPLNLNFPDKNIDQENEETQLIEIERGDFIIIFDELYKEAQSIIISIKSLRDEIDKKIDANYVITYLTDEDGNLQYRCVKKNSMGFQNVEDKNKNQRIQTSKNGKKTMYPIDRDDFLVISANIISDITMSIHELDDIKCRIKVAEEAEYSMKYFTDGFGDIEFTATKRKPMGFNTGSMTDEKQIQKKRLVF